MTSSGPTLNLTYNQLLNQTQEMLRMFDSQRRTPPDTFDAGLRVGVVHHWYRLALSMGATVWDCREDHRQLRLLAGLDPEDLDPPADDHR
ncbi:hypothetical protein UXP03_21695 [Enterobacter hormaechei]